MGRFSLGVPRNTIREVMLDVVRKIPKDLVPGLDPFHLLGVPEAESAN
jgi:hypothetical protein